MGCARKINCYDIDKNFVQKFDSISNFLDFVGLSKTSGFRVSKAIKFNKPIKGFYLEYNQNIELQTDEVFKKGSGNFEISNYGNFRLRNGHITKGSKVGEYYRLCQGKSSPASHVEVAKAFIPNPLNKKFVNHKIKVSHGGSNHVKNLEWVTHQENCIHRSNNKNLPL